MAPLMDIQPIVDYFNLGNTVYYFKKLPNSSKSLRVAIYIRVSTKLQEHKFSLRAQIQELTRYADQLGWDTFAIYRDVDSGGKLDKKGLGQMLDDVDDDKIDIVLCIEQDRLSRLDTVAWEYLKSQLRDNSVKIAEPGNIVDLTNEDDEFISDIKNLIAKREKRSIVKKMMRGKRQRTREGKGWGKPPWEYLYDKNTGRYLVNEEWSWIIGVIDGLCLQGLNDPNIALQLSAITKTPSGKDWNSQHIRQRLTSKLYHGVLEKSFSNGETITVDDVIPKLRTADTWRKIQEKRKVKQLKNESHSPHILRNLHTSCGCCGNKLSIKQSRASGNNPYFYFQHENKLTTTCNFTLNTIRLDFNLENAFKEILDNELSAKQYIQLDFCPTDVEDTLAELATVQKLLQSTQDKLDSLLALYIDPGSAFSKDALNTMKSKLQTDRTSLQAQQRRLVSKEPSVDYETIRQHLTIIHNYECEFLKMEQITQLFSSAILYENRYVLQGVITGKPLEVTIPVSPNPFGNKNKVQLE